MDRIIALGREIARIETKLENSVPRQDLGNKELAHLKSKYGYNPNGDKEDREVAKLIDEFEEWVINNRTVQIYRV